MTVRYAPTEAGPSTGTLRLQTSDGTATVALSGTGQVSGAGLSVAPFAIDFGPVATGSSANADVLLTNPSPEPTTIQGATTATPFRVTGGAAPGTVVAPSGQVGVSISFSPTSTGPASSSLQIATSRGPVSVALSGQGATPGRVELSTTAIDFGPVTVGRRATATFEVVNTGAAPTRITLAKAPNPPFGTDRPLGEGTVLAPGQRWQQSVSFAPTATGPFTGDYRIVADGGDGLQTLQFTGTGVDAPSELPGLGTGWVANGDALITSGIGDLTPASANRTGTIINPTPVASEGLSVSFDATLSEGTGADGMTAALLPTGPGAARLGRSGSGLGYDGLDGVAVALDTFRNGPDPATPFVGITSGGSPDLLYTASHGVAELRGSPHRVTIGYASGTLSVTLDGAVILRRAVALPPQVLIGFTGSTGGATDRHRVANVSVRH